MRGVEVASAILHESHRTMMLIPPRYMKWLLASMEPTSCGPYAIKGLIRKGGKEPPKELMAQLLEYMTDIPENYVLGSLRKLSDVAAWLQSKNLVRARRARDIVFPIEWRSNGIYTVEISEGSITIRDVCCHEELCGWSDRATTGMRSV